MDDSALGRCVDCINAWQQSTSTVDAYAWCHRREVLKVRAHMSGEDWWRDGQRLTLNTKWPLERRVLCMRGWSSISSVLKISHPVEPAKRHTSGNLMMLADYRTSL